MKRCTFNEGKHHCGSYAFNLYNEGIKQGKYCDRHYWQDQAQKARADEREACAKVCDVLSDKHSFEGCYADECAAAIRARSNT